MSNIPDKSIDMIFADLPYGTTDNNKWDKVLPIDILFNIYNRIIKDNGIIILFSQEPLASQLRLAYKYYRYDIIWQKTKPVGFFNAKRMPLRSFENLLIFYKKLPIYNYQEFTEPCNTKVKRPDDSSVYGTSRSKNNEYTMTQTGYPRDIFYYSNVSSKQLHPTLKPLGLVEDIIKLYTNKSDLVLDNTAGVMTTGLACENLGRKWINIELEEKYCELGKSRFENGLNTDLQDTKTN